MNKSHKTRNNRRTRERINRKMAILKAAKKVFFKHGLMAATVDEIAMCCGLAKGTIYLYFKSKEEIYVSLMNEGALLLKKEMEKAAGLPGKSDKVLKRLLYAYYGFYKKHKDYFRIIFLSSHPDVRAKVSEEILMRCMENGRGCLAIVSGAVQKGIENGLFRKVNPWAAANILWAAANGIIMIYEQNPRHPDELVGIPLEDMLRIHFKMALEGLIKR